jgi:type I restriction enzyme S subunit
VLGGKRLPKGFELTNEDTGYPYVRVTDFSGFSVKLPQLRFVPIEAADVIKRYTINSDDVYISIAGTIGLVGQVPPTISGSNLTENAARIVAREGFVPRFLMYQLAAPAAQDQMQQKKIATTQDKLGLFRIKELELLKPSIEEQTEIVCRIEALFAYADRLEARHQAARTQVEKLTPSTLAKAFRGELVTQDPNDEPASALLERIKSGRADGAAKPKRARTTDSAYVPVKLKEKSNMTKSRQDDDVREQPYLAAHLRKLGGTARVESLFDASELPVADFYKQLAWEVSKNMVRDAGEKLELGDAT